HLRRRGTLAYLAGLRVFRAVPPILGRLGAGEFENDETLRRPVAFERLVGAAAHEILALVLRDGRRREEHVLLVGVGVVHGDLYDDECHVESGEWRMKIRKGRRR